MKKSNAAFFEGSFTIEDGLALIAMVLLSIISVWILSKLKDSYYNYKPKKKDDDFYNRD